MVIIPSMPVSAPEGVCPGETQAAITRSPKIIENLPDRIGQSTSAAPYQSTITKLEGNPKSESRNFETNPNIKKL
jgi:hypothetical protein